MYDFQYVSNLTSYTESSLLKQKYLAQNFKIRDVITRKASFVLSIPGSEFVKKIVSLLDGPIHVTNFAVETTVIMCPDVFCEIYHKAGEEPGIGGARNVLITGEATAVDRIITAVKEHFQPMSLTSVRWWYMNKGTPDCTQIALNCKDKVHDEFYPWFPDGIDEFIDGFMDHSASLLFLLGPPGTGKTSFIRYMLQRTRMECDISYEEQVLNSDGAFIDFIRRPQTSCLVFEDAEKLLMDRERDSNPMMSRFLNVSQGLIKDNRKKIVFTTNLDDDQKIDKALLRSGRCYATVLFRPLTVEEQVKAAQVCPDIRVQTGSAPLCDLFHGKNQAISQRMGFQKAA